MMRVKLTDEAMLKAAQRRLAEHLNTRPATRAEAAVIHEQFYREADACLQMADEWRALSLQSINGPWGAYTDAIKEAARCKADASKLMLAAKAWECPGEDMRLAWEAARDELQDRVDYYSRLVARTH